LYKTSGEFTVAQNKPVRKHPEPAAGGLYPIRTVADITGVNAVTLRAWERRYKLINPRRTPKGHRLYSQDQIDLITRVVQLLDQGVAISQVGGFLAGSNPAVVTGSRDEGPWPDYRELMLQAVQNYDGHELDRVYNDALSLYPVDLVTTRLVSPLLQTLGTRWQERGVGVAEEHFFTGYLRNKLGARFHHLNEQVTGPRLVAACLPGEFHDIGLLLFALSAVSHGFRVVMLGANMPLEELPEVARRAGVQGVVLSGSVRPPRRFFAEDLGRLVAQLGVPVFLGGNTSLVRHAEIEEAGAIPLGAEYAPAIETLRARLGF
jgi:DNA-binding transcriptional MerR regulator/methylmalonyl-CoA mutase cobalamin-binding subunit